MGVNTILQKSAVCAEARKLFSGYVRNKDVIRMEQVIDVTIRVIGSQSGTVQKIFEQLPFVGMLVVIDSVTIVNPLCDKFEEVFYYRCNWWRQQGNNGDYADNAKRCVNFRHIIKLLSTASYMLRDKRAS